MFMSQDLVDIEVFHEAKRVIDALQNKEVAPALAWCAENKSRLKKSKVLLYSFLKGNNLLRSQLSCFFVHLFYCSIFF